jgi:MurNAc alpha-1-phosphate uridylyltransferase
MKAMILAAGRGSRMGNLTIDTPKPLTRVGKSTLIEHNILRLKKAEIVDIFINISYLGNQVKEHLKTGKHLGVNITYLDEKENMLGTGGGILNALNFLGEDPFWLVNADLYSDYNIPLDFILEPRFLAHLILVPNPEHNNNGDFFLKNNIVSVGDGKKPHTFSGISLLSPKLFADVNEKKFPLEPLLETNAEAGFISGEFYSGLWSDIGTRKRLNSIESKIK